jgi:hypothetical protein
MIDWWQCYMYEDYCDQCCGLVDAELEPEILDMLVELSRKYQIEPSRLLHEALKRFIELNG